MNSACSSHDEEERAKAGRRKLPGMWVLDVTRWFGQWLRRLQLRWWSPDSAIRGRRKGYRGERKARRRRGRESRWLLSDWLVVVLASCGGAGVRGRNGGGRRPRWREREEGTSCRGEKDVHDGLLQTQWWLASGLGNTWWCWLLKANLGEEMVTVLVSYGGGRKKKQKKKICSVEREEGWFFGLLWTWFYPPSSHQRSLYL